LIRGKIFFCRSMQVDIQKSCSVLCSNRMQKCKINCYFFLCLVSVQGSHNDTRGGCSNAQRPFDDISPKLQSFTLRLNTVVRLLLNPVFCVCFQRQITSWREAIIMTCTCRRYFKIESLYFLWCCIIRRDNAMHSRLCIRQHLDLYSTIKHDTNNEI